MTKPKKVEESTKTIKTYAVRLTKYELLHLRDLFSILLPPTIHISVSQALAAVAERSMVEGRLWAKLRGICAQAEIPLDDDAPDFVIAAAAPPTLSVFHLADSPDEEADDDEEENAEEKQKDPPKEEESLFHKKKKGM